MIIPLFREVLDKRRRFPMHVKWYQNISCKMKQVKIWIGLGLFYAIIPCVLTIDCYHCTSLAGDHKECEDVFARDITTEHLIARECTTGYWKAKFCIKLKGQRVDGTSILIRQCAMRDWGSHCGLIQFDATGTNRFEDIDGCLETCDFDGCNLATTIHCNIPMICLTVISCLLLWTRWQFL